MFYTKYRPQTFSQIARPNEAADALSKQVSTGKTVHAYLFVGPRGTGKTSTARILAKALNCLDLKDNGDPCDTCDMCLAVKNGSLTDLIEIDAASNRGIDDIRDLQDKINLAPTQGKHKIYIIDEVHMLTPPAFNALLKTLEEPPSKVTFILCTTEVHKVPDTIKSRCQVFRFKRATLNQLTTKLKFITESEGCNIEDATIKEIAQASLGGFRDAETLLQQILEGGISIESLLSSSNKETYIDFLKYMTNNDRKLSLELINKIHDDGIDLYVWLGDFLAYVRDLLLFKCGFSAEYFDLSDDILGQFRTQAEDVDITNLNYILNIFLDAHPKIKKSFIPQLPIEIAIIDICGDIGSDVKKVPSPKPIEPVLKNNSKSMSKDTSDISKPVKKETPKSLGQSQVSEDIANPIINLLEIEAKWGSVLDKIKDINGPILAMLKSSKPVNVKGRFLILEVYFAFHKERLECVKNRLIVENVLTEVFNLPLSIVCDISTDKPKKLKDREVGILTDANVVPVDAGEIMNVFDGGLPL